jgi:hypothetical protein
MVDAGAIFKLHSAIIDVGDTVPGIDRSGGSLQVLGTPDNDVIFTSLFNDAIGGRSDTNNFTGANPGDWGGIVFRQASDFQGLDWLGNGVFLDSVGQATFTFGGGQVLDNSVPTVFDPIYISNPDPKAQFFARPAIWFDNISQSADAAMSADPNSFYNSEDRVGPDVYGNVITDNSINGFFIRIRTDAGQPIDVLGLPARIKHTDIVYVLTETLTLAGNPGGPFEPNPGDPNHIGWDARIAGSLVIDPGVIMKLSGATIQAQVGDSQLIAEGTAENPVIFTSLSDNNYGAGGTFQTTNDPNAVASPGNWGGIFFASDSKGSIDHAVIQYAGGTVPIPGGFDQFNPVAIQQADVRIANSFFFSNLGGLATQNVGDGSGNRNGLLFNSDATIFVRGAQPVIVDNQFLDNEGDVLSINADALNNLIIPDWGRSTGPLNAVAVNYQNRGPLINGNTYTDNGTDGMGVRPEEITTQTVWDDADIVHVVRSTIDDSINQHTFGGITLASNADANLVVKLAGANAGFTIDGIPLDINDRIGGTLQIIGSAAHPVILTSLSDDTVGAGFRLDGQPQLDTNGDGASTGSPGDWNGITLKQYSNDRNVAVVLEGEGTAATSDQDGTAATAQFMGTLAPNLAGDNPNQPQGGSDYQPLGFAAFGTINKPSDVDVYSFNAVAGTEVWFDIGLTSPSLASVLELVDAKGNVLASSNKATGTNVLGGSLGVGVGVFGLTKDSTLGGDFYTSNPRDAGMRVILPGAAGTTGTYFIRVRSDQALTAGSYELQVRLRQQWETPGSTIQYSNISYATNGVTLQGLPNNSPVSGNAVSNGTNTSFFGAQNLGNLLTSNTNTLSVAGNLTSPTQIDWYKFTLQYDLIQVITGGSDAPKTLSTIFDIDYADGLSRADTTISVYDSTGRLILVSRDSNVTSDQPGPNQGNGLSDLSRESVGGLDPFIGSQQMPAAVPGVDATTFTYFVAVTSNQMLPQALAATFQGFGPNSTLQDSLVRLEPVTSIKRIVEDHIGFAFYDTGNPQSGNVRVNPVSGPILPIDSTVSLSTTVVPLTLSDVVLYGVSGNDLVAIDPFTGATEYTLTSPFGGFDSANIKMRSDGVLYAVEGLQNTDNAAGQLVRIDTGTGTMGAVTVLGNDSIPNFDPATNPANPNQLTTSQVDSFVWVGTPDTGYQLYYAVHDTFGLYNGGAGASRLYRVNPANGSAAVVSGQPWGVRGEIANPTLNPNPPPLLLPDNTIGFTTGMEAVGNTVFGVTSTGKLISINLSNGSPTVIHDFGAGVHFTGLTLGPQNLNNGALKNILFATTDSNQLMAFDTSGNLQNVFVDGNNTISVSSNARGIAFSPLDFNLWHPTTLQATAAGHGINSAFDNSRNTTWVLNGGQGVGSSTDKRNTTEFQGGASFYFGLENWVFSPNPGQDYITYNNVNSQYGVLSSQFQKNLTSNPSQSGINVGLPGTYNLPGGAHGTLQTNTFSLGGYSAGDNPTLYFTYLLQTEDTNSATDMRDSARVQISTDGGVTWTEVATNNSVLSDNVTSAELARYITPNAAANVNPEDSIRRYVQPLIETNSWRQARIDLSPFAGAGNVQIRFDFSTAGAAILQQTNANSDVGTSLSSQSSSTDRGGALTGVGPNDARAAQGNNFVGFFVDDIIVGFANRGEMVTGATPETTFVQLPQNPKPGAPTQSLIGPYQLEIREGTPYGSTVSLISRDLKITTQFDDNTRFTSGFTLNAPNGSGIDGQTFAISDGVNTVSFEYDTGGGFNGNNVQVSFSNGSSSAVVARAIRDAINSAAQSGKFKVTAELSDGLITGSSSPFGVTDTNTQVDLINAVSVTGSISVTGQYDRFGDQNTPRPQGRIEILNNTISNSQQYAIRVQPNPSPGTDPGGVISLPTLDSSRQVPGVDIVSNVVYNFGTGGVLFQGSTSNSAEVPFGRIVNNTIYGGDVRNGIGVDVKNNAAPTLINNIIANTNTAISIDGTSSATVVGTEVFKNNGAPGTPGTNAISLAAGDPLFVSPNPGSTGNFYLANLSKAIDSSLNTLQDRAQMAAVLSAIGLPPQPIIAPPTDRFGQFRVDDPNVANASGLGNNIFIDRGAVERADATGPVAVLVVPQDNGPGDGNAAVGTYTVTAPITLTQLAVQFTDKGIGVDDTLANNPAAYVLTEQDTPGGPIRTLVNGVDYTFVYNPGTHTAQFNSVSVFPSSAKYTILVKTSIIKDLAGNKLQANQADGTDLLTIIGNSAPTLTAIAPFQGVKALPLSITYAQLVAASTGLSIAPGHTLNFLITGVPAVNGTLQITHNAVTTTVVPGTTRIQSGDSVTWTPAGTATGPTTAFSVEALDVQNAVNSPQLATSFPPVDVIVNQVDIAPKLTTVNTLGPAGNGSLFAIPFDIFLAASDAATVGGHPIGFKIVSGFGGDQGTLQIQIGANAPTNVTFDANNLSNQTFQSGSTLIWSGAAGPATVNAFHVVAWDAVNFAHVNPVYPLSLDKSDPPVQVKINVSADSAPTLNFGFSTVLQLTGPRNAFDVVTFNDLMNGPTNPPGGATPHAVFPAGHVQSFRVDSIVSGTLQISHDGGVNWVAAPVGTIMSTTDKLRWLDSQSNPPNSIRSAFTVAAFDGTTNLASTDGLVTFLLTNAAPVINITPVTLTGAVQQTKYNITYAQLLAATGTTDVNNDTINFLISTRTAAETANGTLQISKGGAAPIAIGTFYNGSNAGAATKFAPGDTLVFTGASGKTGVLDAFKVVAYDGFLVSAQTGQVNVKVDPFGTQFNLTGSWVAGSGLAKITQTGASVSVIDQNNNGATGSYISFNKFTVTGSAFGTKTGTVDTTTADFGRIVWSDGTIWRRLSLGGPYIVNGGGFTNQLASISQNSVQLTYSVGGQTSSGSILNPTQVRAVDFGNSVGTIAGSNITFSNGQVWTKLDLPPTWTSSIGGQPAQILQNGTTTLQLIDQFGSTTAQFTDATHLQAADAKGIGVITQGKITWANGDVWSENLTLTGVKNGTGKTTITATPTSLVMSDGTNTFQAKITSSTTVVITVGTAAMPAGTIGTRQNGKIVWSNGISWGTFDFNALNALFFMATAYPFP